MSHTVYPGVPDQDLTDTGEDSKLVHRRIWLKRPRYILLFFFQRVRTMTMTQRRAENTLANLSYSRLYRLSIKTAPFNFDSWRDHPSLGNLSSPHNHLTWFYTAWAKLLCLWNKNLRHNLHLHGKFNLPQNPQILELWTKLQYNLISIIETRHKFNVATF